uniref:Uncharacterized protein n=1 Tax=viral metagenome TaxID=1070528 RepID=A0A6M3K1A2_9ZZZZ
MKTVKTKYIDDIAREDYLRLTQKFLDEIEVEFDDPTLQEIVDILNAKWMIYAICN